MSQQENIYSVEKIVKYKMIKGKETFLVKWQDYPSSENTWEPKEHLLPHCQFMIDEFFQNNNSKKHNINTKNCRKQQQFNLLDSESEDNNYKNKNENNGKKCQQNQNSNKLNQFLQETQIEEQKESNSNQTEEFSGNQYMQQEQQVQQQQQQQIEDLDKKQQNPNTNQQSPNENEANQQYLNQKKITQKIFEQRNRKYPHILDKVNLETDSCDNKQQNTNNYNECTNEQQYNQDEEFTGKIRRGSFKYGDKIDYIIKLVSLKKEKQQQQNTKHQQTNVENFRFLVKWKYNQKYKILPEQSQVTRKSLKENDIDALVDFYESKIKIHSNH